MTSSSLPPHNLYSILRVSSAATAADIKTAYRLLAVKYHPDKNPDNKASEELFKQIAEAYSILSDTDQRALYDASRGLNSSQFQNRSSTNTTYSSSFRSFKGRQFVRNGGGGGYSGYNYNSWSDGHYPNSSASHDNSQDNVYAQWQRHQMKGTYSNGLHKKQGMPNPIPVPGTHRSFWRVAVTMGLFFMINMNCLYIGNRLLKYPRLDGMEER